MPAKFSTTNDVFFKIYQQKQWRANEALEWMAILSNQHVILEKQKGALQFEKKERCHRVYFTNGVKWGHILHLLLPNPWGSPFGQNECQI